ncbi:MAG: AmmeMemoRadiSam system protein B [Actinomycetes bacterium]
MSHIRPPAVAGLFYPAEPATLARDVDRLLADGRLRLAEAVGLPAGLPKALVLPHAGYVYSGSTAALGYAVLEPYRTEVQRVVLLGPVHRVAVQGLAVDRADAFETPLGLVRAEGSSAKRLPDVVESPSAHALEHSLEVHLPFLQRVLGDVPTVPLAVGRASPEAVAGVLDALWGGPETIIVVSSDLSHYLPYDQARAADEETVTAVLALGGPLLPTQACGAAPVNGLVVAARRHSLVPHLIGLCNSGDTAGDRRRVVGYAAIGFWPKGRTP